MMNSNTERTILKLLYDQNPWWTTERVPETHSKPYRRQDFYFFKNKIDDSEITAIVGPRRVGKTTVLYQLIDYLIRERSVPPRYTLYASFDYPYLATITKTPLNDILSTHFDEILRESVKKLDRKVYVFLDEICKLGEWSRVLKGWYDLKHPIKFVISDSSSVDIMKGSSESLVGRIAPTIMLSMPFLDAVSYMEKDLKIEHVTSELRPAFQQSIEKKGQKYLYARLKEAYAKLVPYENSLKIQLQKYLLKDGYPELLGEMVTSPGRSRVMGMTMISYPASHKWHVPPLSTCAEKLRSYVSLTIYKDIVRFFDIRDPKALEELISLLATETSRRMDYESLARTLGIKRDTLLRYLNYLESVFLISRAEYYSKSRASRIRKNKKIYVPNVGLRNAIVGDLRESLLTDYVELGKVVESLVHEHCKRLKLCLEPGMEPKLFYWKTRRDEEVDIIVEFSQRPIPIEAKYRNDIQSKELKGLNEFLRQHPKSFGMVVTKDKLDMKARVIYLPLWLFLLMC